MAVTQLNSKMHTVIRTEFIKPYINLLLSLLDNSGKSNQALQDYFMWMDAKTHPRIIHYIGIIEDEAVAYQFFIPRKERTLLSGGSFVSPRHKGEFVFLLDDALENLKTVNKPLIYGFSNLNSYPIVKHPYFNYQESRCFKQIILHPQSATQHRLNNIVTQQVSEISEMACFDSYIKWRVTKPNKHYEVLSWEGFNCIFGKNIPNNVDLMTIQGAKDINAYFEALSIMACFVWRENPNWTISLYLIDERLYSLVKDNFCITEFEYPRHLTYLDFSDGNYKLWNIEMIDSDVF
jgi:hypothetical protein